MTGSVAQQASRVIARGIMYGAPVAGMPRKSCMTGQRDAAEVHDVRRTRITHSRRKCAVNF